MTENMKPRSGEVTDGMERAPARAMLRAIGMTDDDWVKPQVAIASSWNEVTPCNMTLRKLADHAKDGVRASGGFPMEFGTITVSDGISMGHEGMRASLVSREVVADSIELVTRGHLLDGVVALSACGGGSGEAIGTLVSASPEDLDTVQELEGNQNARAKASIILVRMRPDEIRSQQGKGWDYEGIVAFSKICTHVGCPVALYEQQTHHLLCPCHQSQFDVSDGCCHDAMVLVAG